MNPSCVKIMRSSFFVSAECADVSWVDCGFPYQIVTRAFVCSSKNIDSTSVPVIHPSKNILIIFTELQKSLNRFACEQSKIYLRLPTIEFPIVNFHYFQAPEESREYWFVCTYVRILFASSQTNYCLILNLYGSWRNVFRPAKFRGL